MLDYKAVRNNTFKKRGVHVVLPIYLLTNVE